MKFVKKAVFIAIILLLAAVTLTACAQVDEVTVTFVVDGNIVKTMKIEKGSGLKPEDIPAVPVKEYYIESWNVTNFEKIDNNITVTAQYAVNFFTANFYIENKLYKSIKIIYGTNPAALPDIYPKAGYDASWSITDFAEIRTDRDVHAVYTPKLMTVTFIADGEVAAVKKTGYNTALTDIPPVPAKTGWVGAWESTDFSAITTDIIVKAVYTPQFLNVRLVGADGETDEYNSVAYDTTFTLPQTQEKTGYVFEGWYTDGTYAVRAANGIIRADVSFYARWITDNFDPDCENYLAFTLLSDGAYAVGAKSGASLPSVLVLPNAYGGKLITEIALDGFKNLSFGKITLPEGLKIIGNGAFYGCANLAEIVFPEIGKITSVGNEAFYQNVSLNSFTLTKFIEAIGQGAFYGCTGLNKINIPLGGALRTIGASAFEGCTILSAVNISDRIEFIGDKAFFNALNCAFNFEGLAFMKSVGESAFENCRFITSFTAPDIESIGKRAFASCPGLTALTVPGNVPVSAYFGTAQFSGSYLVSQQMKIAQNGEYALDNEEFNYAVESKYIPVILKTVNISRGAERIVEYFLSNCFALHTVHIPAMVSYIGEYAFAAIGEDELNRMNEKGGIYFEDGSQLEEIAKNAFERRLNFTSVILPGNLKIIGDFAFNYASNLASVTFKNGDTLQWVGRDAFKQTLWKNLSPDGMVYAGNIAIGYNGVETVAGGLNMVFGTEAKGIAPYAFELLTSNFVSVTIPENVKFIGERAFYGCVTLREAFVNAGVESIGKNAFENCSALRRAVIHEGAEIGAGILKGCRSLITLEYYGGYAAGLLFGAGTYTASYSAAQSYSFPYKGLEIKEEQNSEINLKWKHENDSHGNAPTYYIIRITGVIDAAGKTVDDVVATVSPVNHAAYISNGYFSFLINVSERDGNDYYQIPVIGSFMLPAGSDLKDFISAETVCDINFYIPSSLTTVVFIDSAVEGRTVAPGALKNFTSLRYLTFADGITEIGESAFENCVNLYGIAQASSYLSAPSSLEKIGEKAFKNTSSLNEIRFSGESLISVGEEAFSLSGISTVTFPASLQKIGASAFLNAASLTFVYFAQNADTDLYIYENAFRGVNITLFNAPKNLVHLGENAVSHNPNLGAIVFPAQSALIYLGEEAFAYCPRLLSVTVPSSLDLRRAENILRESNAVSELIIYSLEDTAGSLEVARLFSDTRITVSATYTAVQNGKTYYLPLSLSKVVYNGGYIYGGMFENVSTLRTAEINGVWGIGENAFSGCLLLEKAVIPPSVIAIGGGAFDGCVRISDYGLGSNSVLKEIGQAAFRNNTALTSFYVPSGVNEISASAFENAALLHSVTLISVEIIGNAAFKNCISLTEAVLNVTLKHIGKEAFYNCQNAYFPFSDLKNLEETGDLAFYNCQGLYAFRAENLTKAGSLIFDGSVNLKEVTLTSGVVLGMLFGNAPYRDTYSVLQNGTAYSIPSSLASVVISSKADSVAAQAFAGCYGVKNISFLSEAVPSLGTSALNTGAVKRVYVPLQSKAAYSALLAPLLNLAGGDGIFTSPADYGIFDFILNSGGGYTVKAKAGAVLPESLEIPSYYEGKPVTEIAPSAFAGNLSIKKVKIPSTVKVIGQSAFEGCSNLEEAVAEWGSVLTAIGNKAFYACGKLKEFNVPASVVSIGDYAFAGIRTLNSVQEYEYTSALKRVTFERGSVLEKIGFGAFAFTVSLEEIILPPSLFTIGASAFSFSGVKKVWIDVADISALAFFNCLSLSEITFGSRLKSVGERAFEDCESLSAVNLSGAVTIGMRAFFSCDSLSSVLMPDAATVGSEAFAYCTLIRSVSFSGAVSEIGDMAFFGCTLLETVIIGNDSLGYLGAGAFDGTAWQAAGGAQNGVVYINGVAYKLESGYSGEIVLKDGTTAIAASAFENSLITKITIPASVVKIGASAFRGSSLEKVEFLGVPLLAEIGAYAFYGSNLNNIILPESVRSVGASAFEGISAALSPLPTALTEIGDRAFKNTVWISSSVSLPQSLLTLGKEAFAGAAAEFIIPAGSLLRFIGENAFSGTTLDMYTLPAGITEINRAFAGTVLTRTLTIPSRVTAIGDSAFEGTDAARIVFEEGSKLLSIGKKAFYGLNSTDFIVSGLSALNSVGDEAFRNCALLTSFFAQNITVIGNKAFYGCGALTELVSTGGLFPDICDSASVREVRIATGVTEIKPFAFASTGIDRVVIPATVKKIGSGAFKAATSLEDVVFEMADGLEYIGAEAFANAKCLDNAPSGAIYIGRILYTYKGSWSAALTVSTGTYAISDSALAGKGITSVSIPGSVRIIGAGAFENCTSLVSAVITPGSLISIGARAFAGCPALKTFDMPVSVTSAGAEILDGAASLESLRYSGNVKASSLFGTSQFARSYAVDGIRIPDTLVSVYILDGSAAVAAYALKGFTGVKKVYIANSVESIGESAFENCTALEEVSINPGSKLVSVGSYAFRNCGELFSMEFAAAAVSTGTGIFDGCAGLTALTIGGNMTAANLFSNPASASSVLARIVFADGTVKIADGAFAGIRFSSLVLPASLEEIGERAFDGNTLLDNIVSKGDALSIIGAFAFRGCSSLEEVAFGGDISYIGAGAFKDCVSLETVDMDMTGFVGFEAFKNTPYGNAFTGFLIIGNTLAGYNGTIEADTILIIPSGITEIAENAFKGQSGLTGLEIHENVSYIGAKAFADCVNLEYVIIAGTALKEISAGLFENCPALANITVPSSVTKIGARAFADTGALAGFKMPSLIKEIGDEAFYGSGITAQIELGEYIESIGERAFKNCAAVIKVSVMGGLLTVGDEAFAYCGELEEFIAPSVENQGAEAFYGCTSLTALTLAPNTVLRSVFDGILEKLYISSKAGAVISGVFGTSDAEEVYLNENIINIDDGAFASSQNLKAIYGMNKVQYIGGFAFYHCVNLIKNNESGSFELPITLKGIGAHAFDSASAIGEIIFNGVALISIGDYAFNELETTEFDTGTLSVLEYVGVYAFANCLLLKNFYAPSIIEIGRCAFAGCAAMESVTLANGDILDEYFFGLVPDTLKTVILSQSAFELAAGALKGLKDVESVNLSYVRKIGENAFEGMLSLTSLVLPASLLSIGEEAFKGCVNLENISFAFADVLTYVDKGAFDSTKWYTDYYSSLPDGTVYIGRAAYSAKGNISGTLKIKDGTVSITAEAFKGQKGITAIELPLSLDSAGYAAFGGCNAVTSVTMNGAVTVGTLFGSDLYDASYSVVQNSVTYYIPLSLNRAVILDRSIRVTDEAFKSCYTLKTVVLPADIGAGANVLSGCYGITNLTAPGSLTAGELFGTSSYLESYAAVQNGNTYYIPNALASLTVNGSFSAVQAYKNLKNLTALRFADGFSVINANAFEGCVMLYDVVFPASLKSVAQGAFKDCTGLINISIPQNTMLAAGIFDGCNRMVSLSVGGLVKVAELFGNAKYQGSYEVSIKGVSYSVPLSLATVSFTGSVITDYALSGFVNVVNVAVSSETVKIGAYAFSSLQSLREITLPASLVEIGAYAFYQCRLATFIFTENNVESVGDGAFEDCEALTVFNSAAVKYAGSDSFAGCRMLETLSLPAGADIDKVFGNREFAHSFKVSGTNGTASYEFYLPLSLKLVIAVGTDADFYMLNGIPGVTVR